MIELNGTQIYLLDEMIDKRVSELKTRNKELMIVIDSIIIVMGCYDNQSMTLKKSIKKIWSNTINDFIIASEIDVLQLASIKLLSALIKTVNKKQYKYIIHLLEETNVIDIETITNLQKERQSINTKEDVLYFIFTFLLVCVSYLIFKVDINKIEFIPIIAQVIVITASVLLKKEYALKIGVVFSLLSVIFIYSLRSMVYDSYQINSLLIISYLLLGMIISLLPKLLHHLLRLKLTMKYRLYIETFIPSIIFTVILTIVNMRYTHFYHLNYTMNPFLKLLQSVFISIICVQFIEIMNQKKLITLN